MNKIPELNPIEKKLKQFYRKSKERMLDVPCTRDEIMDVLLSSYTAMPDKNITQSLKTQIDEQIFILENMDVSFVRRQGKPLNLAEAYLYPSYELQV